MATTDNLAITEVAPNQDQKETTINNGLNQLDNATQGLLAISFTANARTLTATEFTSHLDFQCGALTAAGTLTIPNTKRLFTVDNRSSGHSCTITNGSGSTVAVPSGVMAIIRNNGTDVVAPSSITSAGVSSAAGSGEIIVSPTIGAVVVSLGTIASGHLLANAGTVTAVPGDTSLTALLDTNFGTITESILQRNGSVWAGTTIITGITLTSATVTGLPAPTGASDAVNKGYVDTTIQGLSPKASATWATAAALAANTYANGASGVGATLTATGNGALSVDGGSPAVNDRVLVKNEVAAANNGLYTVTAAGSVSTAYVLTRHVDMDQAAEVLGAFIAVESGGTANSNTLWLCTTTGAVTVGTTAITFTQLNSATSLSAGPGINIGAGTISALWNAGTVTAIGSNLALVSGTLSGTAGGGSVTSVVAGPGLNGGTITSSGTLTANWNGGTVTALGDGVGLNSGTIQTDHQGTITLSGTTTGTITPAEGVTSEIVNVGTAAGTIAVGSGLYNGQHLRLEIIQGATAHTVGFDSTVAFGTDITSFTATVTAAARDLVQLVWNGTKWMLVAVNHGF